LARAKSRFAPKGILSAALFVLCLNCAYAQSLTFDEIYDNVGVMGLSFSKKVELLSGKKITIDGFMAPPLKAKSNFFVLTKMPMALCPFCSSDTDWSSDIIVVYLKEHQTFVQYNAIIRVEGILEYGSYTDENSGFVSLLRLREASFKTL
jgi:hypothetical protein